MLYRGRDSSSFPPPGLLRFARNSLYDEHEVDQRMRCAKPLFTARSGLSAIVRLIPMSCVVTLKTALLETGVSKASVFRLSCFPSRIQDSGLTREVSVGGGY